jgi:cytochrome c biogenesis protein
MAKAKFAKTTPQVEPADAAKSSPGEQTPRPPKKPKPEVRPPEPAPPPKSWVWGTLTSIRLTVFLLLILAALAVVGTVIPQDQPLGQYIRQYGEGLGMFLYRSGITSLYYSPWFLGPIGLLALNISACLVHGLPRALRRSFRRLTPETAAALPERGHHYWPGGTDPHPLVAAALKEELGRPHRETFQGQEIYFWEQGRFRPLGPYLVHLSLLLILAGGLIGKFWGVEGRLALGENEQADAFVLPSRDEQPLGFQVRLDKFYVDFYGKGAAPKEFRSDLTIFQSGKEPETAACRVNEPVTFGKYTLYQSSYGAQPAGPVVLQIKKGDLTQTVEVPLRKMVDLPGGQGQVIAMQLQGDLEGYGPAVQLAYRSGPGHPQAFWLLKDHPEKTPEIGPYRISLAALPFKWYSVFQVKYDPGVWWVYAGFILLLPGFYLAFFRVPQRWAVILEPTPRGGWKGRLLGASPRSRDLFLVRQDRLLELLKKGTKP